MHNAKTATHTSKSSLSQQRIETMRPFVKKYQYFQLPLPEPVTPETAECAEVEIPHAQDENKS
jgi:hypothetical protein